MAKKVSAIVSLSIIGVLIIATIIMANVQCSYGVNFKSPDLITVSYANSGTNLDTTEAQRNNIVSLINNASKENTLTAMFSGTLFDTAEVSTPTSNTSTIKKDNSKFYVYVTYNNPQKLMVGNKEYKDSEGKVYYYKELVFEVADTNGVAETNVYIIPSYKPNTDNEPYLEGGYTRKYTVKANYSQLFKYLDENFR